MTRTKKLSRKLIVIAVAVLTIFAVGLLRACTEPMRHPNSDTNIDAQLENQIRRDFVKLNPAVGGISDIYIGRYLGTYNESSVVHPRGLRPLPPAMEEEVVAGFEFWTNTGNPILVWRNGKFYSLTEAYDNDLISTNDMQSIWNLWTQNWPQ